jgi:hypothetical protein
MKTWRQRTPGIVCVLLLVSSIHLTARTSLADRPSIVVKVVADNLPDELNPDPPVFNIPAKLTENLESFAVQQLTDRFPLFKWFANHTGQATNPEAVLTFELAKEPGITWKIYLTCSLTLRGAQPMRISISEPTLYEDGEQFAAPTAVEQQALQRGRRALTILMEDTLLDRWREKVIRQIRLTDDLLHAPAPSSILVLPLSASELQADQNSKIRVELVTRLPGATPKNSSFELSPGGPVRDGMHVGMQECTVIRFDFDGMVFDSYVTQIAEVIQNKIQTSVSVRAYYYVKRDSPAWSHNP